MFKIPQIFILTGLLLVTSALQCYAADGYKQGAVEVEAGASIGSKVVGTSDKILTKKVPIIQKINPNPKPQPNQKTAGEIKTILNSNYADSMADQSSNFHKWINITFKNKLSFTRIITSFGNMYIECKIERNLSK